MQINLQRGIKVHCVEVNLQTEVENGQRGSSS